MQRRTALKNIGLSFGALTLTPTLASLIQSCQTTDPAWAPSFLSQESALLIEKTIDVMLPTTANMPGATDLNLIRFVDSYIENISSKEEQEFAKMAIDIYAGAAQTTAGKESIAALTSEDIDQQLNDYLRPTPEKQASRSKAFYAYMEAIEAGTAGSPPIEGICQNLLNNLKNLAVLAFKHNEVIAKEHMVYAPVPGQQKGCVDLQEATGGKAWAL
ncbi:gluconate 2-dehydrogenase subunit 3 family protein [Flavobacteriaceae bacterium]|nr:gluconate 2-dehydrogenase subunit 3 family protein [Flavobacteriaceae bacterium]MDB4186111.1 gluconate 2-dehydrogenase subunit 3 family protein [Flavobacteriaceae bacterium]